MRLARVALVLYGVGLAGFGVVFLFAPEALMSLTGVELPSGVARQEIRGVYGGLFLGVAALFLLGAREDAFVRPGLVALACTMGGLVVGRVTGLVMDGRANAVLYSLLVLEVIGTATALLLLPRIPVPRRETSSL